MEFGADWCILVQFGGTWCSLEQLGAVWCQFFAILAKNGHKKILRDTYLHISQKNSKNNRFQKVVEFDRLGERSPE